MFHQFSEYPLDVVSVPLDMLFFRFFWASLGVDGHVIHVNHQPFFGNFFGEYQIHHCLEGGW